MKSFCPIATGLYVTYRRIHLRYTGLATTMFEKFRRFTFRFVHWRLQLVAVVSAWEKEEQSASRYG